MRIHKPDSTEPRAAQSPHETQGASALSAGPRLCACGRLWSAFGVLAALSAASLRLESVEEGVEAGGEPFVAVVEPDVFAEGDEGGEAVGR